ncbi:hypothetical protein FB45DRAFT_870313 [Roridomyces roridus]|uniref:Uncharacterized protein n=1 Tax=Roridomyces roridus TaxID=1738132 RepID=A0AAD7FFY6_9AGAR|nr:hypothetical protein FB45DRAFT_870313 [Roridomyces roridus]
MRFSTQLLIALFATVVGVTAVPAQMEAKQIHCDELCRPVNCVRAGETVQSLHGTVSATRVLDWVKEIKSSIDAAMREERGGFVVETIGMLRRRESESLDKLKSYRVRHGSQRRTERRARGIRSGVYLGTFWAGSWYMTADLEFAVGLQPA